MPATFEGEYFDGKTGLANLAQVNLEPSALRITYKAQDGTLPVQLFWQINRIQQEFITGTNKAVIRYGINPVQTLAINSPDFLPTMEAYYTPAPAQKQVMPLKKERGLGWIWLLLLVFIGAIGAGYFWIMPAVAGFAAKQVPAAYEQKLGKMMFNQIVSPTSIDSVKTNLIQSFARQLPLKATYPIQVTVLKNDELNAFAIPGGHIVVHQGILDIIKSPDELAALLAHEYAHVKLRHSTRTLFRTLSGYIFISALLGDLSGMAAVVVENADALKSLHYSRELEKEADILGISVMQQKKLNPYGMIQLFEHLKEQTPDAGNEFISTHPLLESRISYVKELLKNSKSDVIPNDSLQYYWEKLK